MPLPPDLNAYYAQMNVSAGWRVILASFARFVAPPAGAISLDVGCARGALVEQLAVDHACRAYGVDYAFELLRQAGHGQGFVVGALPFLPFRAGVFDLITATNVLYLLDQPSVALHELVRLLPKGGMFAMLNPSPAMNRLSAAQLAEERGLTGFERDNFITWGEVAEQHVRWSAEDIETLFAEAGLRLIETQTRIGAGLARYAKGLKV
jgi:ubiquinone/menaquinone biosynthesis C-methylase UbiE